MDRLTFTCAWALFAVPALFSTPLFPPDALYWATKSSVELFHVGDSHVDASDSFARLSDSHSDQFGQLTFDPTGAYAYATITSRGKVVRIAPDGTVEDFAWNLSNPTGIAVTDDGQILVATWAGRIYDITAGGKVGTATYASGLSGARNMIVTAEGIFVAEQLTGEVTRVVPGNLTGAPAFATGLVNPIDFALLNAQLYVVTRGDGSANAGKVYDITSGGSQSGAMPFASGGNFVALAVAGDRLYVSTDDRETSGARIWDITGGGSVASIPPWAVIVAGKGDSMFAASPGGPSAPVSSVPEPGTIAAVAAGLGLVMLRSRAHRR